MTSVYFPARTNVHYWDLEPLELDLESRIKLSAILYDELIFDDGLYMAFIGPQARFEMRSPIEQLASDKILENQFAREGGQFYVAVGDSTRIESPAQRRYKLCFRSLLEEAGLVELPWLNFTYLEFNEDGKKSIRQMTRRDMEVLHDGDLETYYLRYHALHSVNHDWIIASLYGCDPSLDPFHEVYLKQKLALVAKEAEALNPPVDFEIIFPELPDLTRVSWDQILEVRDHPSAAEFRQGLASVSGQARRAYLAGESADAIRYHVTRWYNAQLITEIEEQLTTGRRALGSAAISLLFVIGSLLPGIGNLLGAIDAVRSAIEPLVEYAQDRKSLAAAFVRRHRTRD